MKIRTNFISPVSRLAPALAGTFWLVSLIALVVTGVLLVNAYSLRRDQLPELEAHLAKLEGQPMEPGSEPVPPPEKLATLKKRVSLINQLSGYQAWPLPSLLAQLENTLPEDAQLANLHVRQRTGEVQMVVEGTRAEILSAFMVNLEKSGKFDEVLLTRQSQRTSEGRKLVQFEFRLKERL